VVKVACLSLSWCDMSSKFWITSCYENTLVARSRAQRRRTHFTDIRARQGCLAKELGFRESNGQH